MSKIHRFGTFSTVSLADQQQGPACGFEAIENIIQLFHNVGNDLVEKDLLARAKNYQATIYMSEYNGYALDVRAYQRILQDYGIPSLWYAFDHLNVMLPALRSNLGVLVIGDAVQLDPQHYLNTGQAQFHAFVVTNYYTDESGYFLLGYTGIDSTVAQTEMIWSCQNVENAVRVSTQYLLPTPVLITTIPIRYASAQCYRMSRTGTLMSVSY